MEDIESRIVKTELIQWRSATWLQANLKELSDTSFRALKTSLKQNGFAMPFAVWEEIATGTLWILDGHHRQKAMLELEVEGYRFPDELPANFVDCQNITEAARLVLVYSSVYASVTSDGLFEHLERFDLDFDSLSSMMVLPALNMEEFATEFLNKNVIPDVSFNNYDESIADGVELCNCPTCGYEHARKK